MSMTTDTANYRIAEVARRSGFSTPTLRYYEEIGLVRPVSRTDSGYRLYDDAALERLSFVARGKDLGCSLTEIAGLLAAWDADCEDVRARFRALVDGKIADGQRQIAELIA